MARRDGSKLNNKNTASRRYETFKEKNSTWHRRIDKSVRELGNGAKKIGRRTAP